MEQKFAKEWPFISKCLSTDVPENASLQSGGTNYETFRPVSEEISIASIQLHGCTEERGEPRSPLSGALKKYTSSQ